MVVMVKSMRPLIKQFEWLLYEPNKDIDWEINIWTVIIFFKHCFIY